MIILTVILWGIVFDGQLLPARVEDEIIKQQIRCDDHFPIWPGELRMPTCDEAEVEEVGLGTIPVEEAAEGVTKAVCYIVRTSNLYWGYNVRHEMFWYERTSNKVAIKKQGEWILFTDQEEDRKRWSRYKCPGDDAIE